MDECGVVSKLEHEGVAFCSLLLEDPLGVDDRRKELVGEARSRRRTGTRELNKHPHRVHVGEGLRLELSHQGRQ